MSGVVVVYHTKTKHVPCFDGLCAATLLWNEFGYEAEYIPAYYGSEVPLTRFVDKRVYFVDFAYPIEVMDKIAAVSNFLLVFDSSLDESIQRSYLTHNKEASASVLVWRHLQGSDEVPRFVELIDRGARFVSDPDLEAFNGALNLEVSDFPTWSKLIAGCKTQDSPEFLALLDRGLIVRQYSKKHIDILCNEAFQVSFGGYTGLAVNANKFYAHNVAVELARRSKTFGASFFLRSNGSIEVSLRKVDSDVDLSKIASLYGGGGTSGAASFSVSIEKFRELMHQETRPQLLARIDTATRAFQSCLDGLEYTNTAQVTTELVSYLRALFGQVVEALYIEIVESVVQPNLTVRLLSRTASALSLPKTLSRLSWYHRLFPYRLCRDFSFDEDAIRDVLIEAKASESDPAFSSFLVDTLIGSVDTKTRYELVSATYYIHITITLAGCKVPIKHTFKVLK